MLHSFDMSWRLEEQCNDSVLKANLHRMRYWSIPKKLHFAHVQMFH